MNSRFRTVCSLVKKPHVSKGIHGMYVKELLVLYKDRASAWNMSCGHSYCCSTYKGRALLQKCFVLLTITIPWCIQGKGLDNVNASSDPYPWERSFGGPKPQTCTVSPWLKWNQAVEPAHHDCHVLFLHLLKDCSEIPT